MSALLSSLAIVICTVATALALWSLLRATARGRRRRAPAYAHVPVTVLKPLCGVDDALEANLETFFAQSWPAFELVFGVVGADDPAAAVVRRLGARHPHVPWRLVVHDGLRGLNPKVSQLRAMLEAGGHDLVVVSDSNVAAPPDYLSRLVGQLVCGGRVGVVTSLIAGVGEETVGATLDALHLNGYVAGNVAATQELGDRAVTVGKSMLFRRSVFERLGGFESVATLLAEDYVMGRMFLEAGYQVRLCTEPVRNVTGRMSVGRFLRRHLRWGLLRSRLRPFVYLAEPLSNPMAVGVVAAAALGAGWPLAWALALTLSRDALGWLRLRGAGGLAAALPLGPAKDLALFAVWAVAPFLKRITWRQTTVRVGAGTRLYAEAPGALPGASTSEGSPSPAPEEG